MSDPAQLVDIRDALIEIAQEAAALTLAHFHAGCASERKADGSIVTIADTEAEALIKSRLSAQFPDVAFLGEESVAAGIQPDFSSTFFCIDPIDGTRQFASGDHQWVNALAYVEAGRPMVGVICAPALSGRLFAGIAGQGGFELHNDGTRTAFLAAIGHSKKWRVVHGGHDKAQAIQAMLPPDQAIDLRCVSSALKFGLVAASEADVFARAGSVWDWDIAAGQAIIEAAGGRVLDDTGRPLIYGQRESGYRHPPFVAARAGINLHQR